MTIAEIVSFIGTIIPESPGCTVTACTMGRVRFTGYDAKACQAAKKAVGLALVEKLDGVRKVTHARYHNFRTWRLTNSSQLRCGIDVEITEEEDNDILLGRHEITRF